MSEFEAGSFDAVIDKGLFHICPLLYPDSFMESELHVQMVF